jgi:ABC-2 type transport system permease protein
VTRLVRSELRKLLTTQVWFWLLLGALALSALGVVGQVLTDGSADNPGPRLVTAEGQRNLFAQSSAAGVFVAILAIIGMTGEYRHLTVTPTFLGTPRRTLVVIAKLITYTLVGLAYSVLCAVLVVAMAKPWLAAKGIPVSLTDNRIPLVLLAAVVAVAIYGIVGVGIGALVRNQVAAVVLTLAFLFVVEPLIGNIPWVRDHVYKFLPGGAAAALTQTTQPNATLLEPWQGGLLLAGYGIAFAVLGALTTVRRDVT